MGKILLNEAMKDRIRQIMESQHMTQNEFAEFIGTTPATLSGIFNDRTRPTLNIVEAIKKKISDINTDWLIFGHGSMYRSDNTTPDSPTKTPDTGFQRDLFGNDPISDFAHPSLSTLPNASLAPSHSNSVRPTHLEFTREDLKKLDKQPRKVTEIRVYYDDQTWESFLPAKK